MKTIMVELPNVDRGDRIDVIAASSYACEDDGLQMVTTGQHDERSSGEQWRELARKIFYGAWRLLPGWTQALAFRLGAPKVSMGAVAVIQDARGRILLAHHTYRQRAWGLPGGLVSWHEQPADAVARELREELGVAAVVGSLLHAETCAPNNHLTLYYMATIDGEPQQDGVEIDGFRYVAPDEVAVLMGAEATAWLASLRRMTYPRTWAS